MGARRIVVLAALLVVGGGLAAAPTSAEPSMEGIDRLASAEAGGGAVTVTPSAGLVDGDTVQVSGTSWSAGHRLFITLCDSAALVACAPSRIAGHLPEVTADGSFGPFDLWVRTVFDSSSTEVVDCRVDACAVHVVDLEASAATASPVAFDPGGALLPPASIAVSPSVDVVDGDVLTIHGDGFLPYASLEAMVCPARATRARDCDEGGDQNDEFLSGRRGIVDEEIDAIAVFHDRDGDPIDCRAVACEVAIFHFYWDGFLRGPPLATAPVVFDPDGALLPPPTLRAEPTSDLAEVATIHVSGTGYRTLTPVEIVQCPTATTLVRPIGLHQCDYHRSRFVRRLEGGVLDADIVVHRSYTGVGDLQDPDRVVDCTAEPCSLYVIDYRDEFPLAIPIEFAAAPSPTGPVAASPTFTG